MNQVELAKLAKHVADIAEIQNRINERLNNSVIKLWNTILCLAVIISILCIIVAVVASK